MFTSLPQKIRSNSRSDPLKMSVSAFILKFNFHSSSVPLLEIFSDFIKTAERISIRLEAPFT